MANVAHKVSRVSHFYSKKEPLSNEINTFVLFKISNKLGYVDVCKYA